MIGVVTETQGRTALQLAGKVLFVPDALDSPLAMVAATMGFGVYSLPSQTRERVL